jgi:acyl-CoA thioesterase-1
VVFQQLAAKNNLELIPFLLENVGGIAHLNQSDGIHPNPRGHKIVAENVWRVLQGLL